MTLESHFMEMSQQSEEAKELYSIWNILKKDMEKQLVYTQSAFTTFSLHDSSHSRSIVQNIERFLGSERVSKLSITDTFAILTCAYAHDYGMALTADDVYELLKSGDLQDFLFVKNEDSKNLEPEDAWAIQVLTDYIRCENGEMGGPRREKRLEAIYLAILMVIQMYVRPGHWKGVERIEEDYKDLLRGRVNIRFLRSIVAICQAHGQDIECLEKLEPEADGFAGDVYHPRFVAAMLRLGDLLDVDNNRFPKWFFEAQIHGVEMIPKLSELHFKRHEAISHIRITPEYIAITAACFSDDDGYEVAELVAEWFNWIHTDCEYLSKNWASIGKGHFGAPPGELRLRIYVDNRHYSSTQQTLRMQMSQDRVMKLLEGSSIYQSRFVGIRELLQNAVDASLLQLWSDVINNRYDVPFSVSEWLSLPRKEKESHSFPLWNIPSSIYANYSIKVEVIWDEVQDKILLVVKDKGIGITPDDVKYMANIGSSKDSNKRVKKLMDTMPEWLKPSGVFGIGLQSVFQMTDKIYFYTRCQNEPDRLVVFYSYGRNRGKTEIRELNPGSNIPYFDSVAQGTSVVIELDIDRMFSDNSFYGSGYALNFDPEFTPKSSTEAAYIIASNLVKEEVRIARQDYFNVRFSNAIWGTNARERLQELGDRHVRGSAFLPGGTSPEPFLYTLVNEKQVYNFNNLVAKYWDEATNRFYRLQVLPSTINGDQVSFPAPRVDLYRIMYKFNDVSHLESLYCGNHSSDYLLNMMRVGMIAMNVLIMDDKPTKYLNIDRDRLKAGSLLEEELLSAKQKILIQWCDYFVKKVRRGRTYHREFAGLRRQPGLLISLMLLFYRYAPESLFREFAKYFEQEVGNFRIQGCSCKVKQLWDGESRFKTIYRISGGKTHSPHKDNGTVSLGPTILDRLSHRLFRIKEICGSYNQNQSCFRKMCYIFCVEHENSGVDLIEMNDEACLFDYIMAFDNNADNKQKTRFVSIVKKVFKPDSQYPEIITPVCPKGFHYGQNFCWRLDRSIRGIILSPFDEISANILKTYLADIEPGNEETKKRFCSDMETYMFSGKEGKASVQLDNCVQYVFKKRKMFKLLPIDIDEQNEKDQILKTYRRFVRHFCNMMYDYRTLLQINSTDSREKNRGDEHRY